MPLSLDLGARAKRQLPPTASATSLLPRSSSNEGHKTHSSTLGLLTAKTAYTMTQQCGKTTVQF